MSPSPTVSGRLADFIHQTSHEELPAAIVSHAKMRLLDCLGTALAAHGLHVPSVALAFVKGNEGPASILGYPDRVPVIDAAFVNATLINGRSQDDFLCKSHPGALTVPSALAVAEAEGRSGAEVLAAIVVGYEVVGRVYLGGPRMLPRFRASGVAGTVGAAATAAKLLRLDALGIRHALGCAAVFAHGFGQGYLSGTNEVKLNVGMASRNGLSAAMLARHGATASALAFEGDAGFYRAFDGSLEDVEEATHDLGDRYLIEDTVYKECPVCIFTQTPIALARGLAPRIDPKAVEKVVITSPELTHTNPGFTNVAPYETHLQAVVSARFCTAAALLGRPVEEHDFYDELRDPEVLALAGKIELRPRPQDAERVEIEVVQRSGRLKAVGIENDTLRPTPEKVIAKFRRLTANVEGLDHDAVIDTVQRLDKVTRMGDLMGLLAPKR